ncbi:MAG: UDP-N-acetylglucosamine 2-epimerase [Clostridium sp.]|uniref:UDP-N-acetylglucosamine 2-epimerase n=1 Tax=Clostridium sp. TaxID=1506 RepID=UPI0025C20077|nr:UDP-N-acetylglucosamine 2-epimerase [Clostridium sp.]MCH3964312.1 UDP-N-acetylglucosamine 2-epimerase [Clostridium sp.]MCI1715487.1 UDP-N-acetylglucosamine 2-epimerase [Clostridium sp.]MCI1799721.1 UDP-N-acetylglucosamine 2-epimerase [Clostridium sp.]MCI1813671.1 UDP-N-acetylglucosamine 2-epimerase [Clostridium sp.]MCI1870534.1 UDP-N-acetylglucosamine 2-epimerase [Clostridium sp.]
MKKIIINLFYILSQNKKYISIHSKNENISNYLNEVSREEIFNYIKFLECQNYNGFYLEDIYMYDDIPLYFFFRDTLYARVEHLLNCIEIINQLENKFSIDDIIVTTDSFMMYNVATQLFNLQCIKVKPTNKNKKEVNSDTAYLLDQRSKIGIKHLSEFKKKYLLKKNFLVLSHAMNLNIINDTINKKQFYYDTQIGPIIDRLKENYNILNIQKCNKISLNKSIESNLEYYPYEQIENIISLENVKVENNKIIINDKILKNLNYKYKKLNLYKIIVNNFFSDYKERCDNALKRILILMNIFKQFKIEKCLIMDETYSGRPFIFAANKLWIKSFSCQHGIITNKRFSQAIESKYNDILAPTKTFVWGKFFKEKLINNGTIYSDSNVLISGQVRTDLIFKYYINQRQNKCSQTKNTNKVNILYITQGASDTDKPAIKILFNSLKKLDKDYNLIIKLHPADAKYNFYKNMTKQYNLKNFKIVQNYDLYLLLQWCDFVVNVFSTVTQEALIFNKKCICILLPKYGDASGFVKDGIALGVKDEYELLNNITKINKKNILNNKILEKRFYKIDGHVTDRIVKAILIEKQPV